MSHQSPLSLEPSMLEPPTFSQQPSATQSQKHPSFPSPSQAQNPPPPSDWIPPPASLATVNSDAIDLNDEVFFNYNAAPAYTTAAADSFAPTADFAASSSSSSTANFDYSALQHDLAVSPLKYPDSFDTHYSHTRRFSSAVEQLNRMSLRAHSSSKSPSPDLYSVLQEPLRNTEARTVNPRHLFGSVGFGGPGSSGNTAPNNGAPVRNTARYILPSSVSSPALSTFFSSHSAGSQLATESGPEQALEPAETGANGRRTSSSKAPSSALNNPLNPYVMNDECVSAITYWLNNTADVIAEKTPVSSSRNPTGVVKPGWARRNSIQVASPRTEDGASKAVRALAMDQKRRRRKSVNTAAIPEGSLPASLALNMAQVQTAQAQVPPYLVGDDVLSIPPQSLTLPSSKREEKEREQFENAVFDGMDVTVPESVLSSEFKGALAPEEPGFLASGNPMVLDPAPGPSRLGSGHNAGLNGQNSGLNGQTSLHRHSSGLSSGHPGNQLDDDEPKPFPCPDCEKQFKRSEHLKRHIRSVHSNIRPFHCKYCEKKFSRSDNLAQHSKTHFKTNSNGTTTVIYGNPNPSNRGGRKKSTGDIDMDGSQDADT